MACEHAGPAEVIEMAEGELKRRALPESQWDGSKFRYSETVEQGRWASVCLEVERVDGAWLVTRIDRMPERLPSGEEGFRVLTLPA